MRGKTIRLLLAPALLSLALLPACGSSGSSGGGPGGGGTGGSGTAFLSGTVDGFGSVLVNGVKLETPAGTPVTIDDNPVGLDDLQVGMVAEVRGNINDDLVTGQATGISVSNEIQGPLGATNLAGGTLTVMGQTVRLTDTTVFADNTNVGALTAGQILEVHGLRNADGSVRATRIELKVGEQELEVKGTIAGLGAQTFTIGALTVNHAGATLDPTVAAAGGLANGLVVEVKSLQALQNGVLMASSIKVEGPELEHGLEVRAEGIVTAVNSLSASAADFVVQGQRVTATLPIELKRGDLSNIAVGRVVEVEGTMDNGVLVAREVSFELVKTVKIEATLTQAPGANSLTVAGVTVRVDNATLLRDKLGNGSRTFSLASLAEGDRVDVRGFVDDDGAVVAARLEREDPRGDNRAILQGPASGVSNGTVTVLGASVSTAAMDSTRFQDVNGFPLTPDQFLQQAVLTNNLVKFRGTQQADGSITWERAEIETEHEFANEDNVNEFEFEFENEVETPG